MKNEQRLPVKNGTLLALNFILCLSGSVLLSSGELIGLINNADLPETPLGFYEKRGFSTRARLPERHRLEMSPAKNQGRLGTCASFATTACGEYYYPDHLFSEAELTVLAETQLTPKNGGDCRPGLFVGKALHVAQDYGFVDQSRLFYTTYLSYVSKKNGILSSNWKQELGNVKNPTICRRDYNNGIFNPLTSYNNTMKEMGVNLRLYGNNSDDVGYTLGTLYPIHHVSKQSLSFATRGVKAPIEAGSIGLPMQADIHSIKKALAQGYPVAAALPVFEGCWDGYSIQMPTRETPYTGSHAVVLTGYTDDEFILKNSWGQSWGDNGFGEIPQEYVKTYSTELVAVGN